MIIKERSFTICETSFFMKGSEILKVISKCIIAVLLCCVFIGGTVCAADEEEYTDNYILTGKYYHNLYGDIDAKYLIRTDLGSTIDTYVCYKTVEGITTRCGFLFVSDYPATITHSLIVDYGKNGGLIWYSGATVTKLENDASDLFAWYDSENGHEYWMSYLSQFGVTDENYEEFRTWCKGKYIGYYPFDLELIGEVVSCSTMELVESETTLPDKISTVRICNPDSMIFWEGKGNVDVHFFAPFVYGKKTSDSDSDSNGKRFIVYCDRVDLVQKLSLIYKLNFTWKVDDYPEYKDGFIEVRACPFVYFSNDVTGFSKRDVDWYYFSSIDSTKIKTSQKNMPKVSFNVGLATAYKDTLDNYYYNWFEKIMNSLGNISDLKQSYTYQVRAVSADEKSFSDWCTFHFNALGEQVGGVSIYDDDDNLIESDIRNDDDYDKTQDKPGDPFEDEAGTSDYDDNVVSSDTYDLSSFVKWLRSCINAIGDFPKLLETCYGWLPQDVITAIGVSLALIVLVRVLGR